MCHGAPKASLKTHRMRRGGSRFSGPTTPRHCLLCGSFFFYPTDMSNAGCITIYCPISEFTVRVYGPSFSRFLSPLSSLTLVASPRRPSTRRRVCFRPRFVPGHNRNRRFRTRAQIHILLRSPDKRISPQIRLPQTRRESAIRGFRYEANVMVHSA